MNPIPPSLLGDFLARRVLLIHQGHARCFSVADRTGAIYLVWTGFYVPEQRQEFFLVPATERMIDWLLDGTLTLANVFAGDGLLFVRYADGRAPTLTPCRGNALPDSFERPSAVEWVGDPPNTPGRACAMAYRLHEQIRDTKYPLHTLLQRLRTEAPSLTTDPDFRDAERRLRQADEAREQAAGLLTAAHVALLTAYKRAGLL